MVHSLVFCLFSVAALLVARGETPAAPQTVVGVVNWDCSLPSDTWLGHYATRSLSPAKYRYATPYYADVVGPDKIDYRWRTVGEYEREMRYAIDAGIDYFAYCWYGELREKDGKDFTPVADGPATCSDRHVWELTTARRLHAESRLRDKLKMCAILVVSHPIADAEFESLARTMKEPWYQTALGRPLVYLYGGKGQNQNVLPRLRAACRKMGAKNPYAVTFACSRFSGDGDDGVQAIGKYTDGTGGIDTFAELAAYGRAANSRRVATGMDMIPTFTLGWDPSPRIDNNVPWCSYEKVNYARPATEAEWLEGARAFAEWVKANRASCPTGHILSFAWNEFEEGAWICPTWRPDGKPDTRRVQAFRKVGELWRKMLDEPAQDRRPASAR